MIINDMLFNVELIDILNELKRQCAINGINILHKFVDSSTDVMICCPYHKDGQERRPSAGIRKSDGLFHCFACGETHSLTEVISHCLGYSDVFDREGWKWLAKNFLSIQVEEREDIKLDMGRIISSSISESLNTNYVSEEELDSYRYIHPYMYKRGLTDEVIELFDIGYDKNTQCITFPVRDIKGNTLFIARRNVNYKFFNYPSGVEKPVYGLYELQYFKPNEIIICESMLDALKCWTFGKFAVALNGTGNELQYKQLNNLSCRKFILATDNDKAGMIARKKLRQNITHKLVSEYVLPDGKKDINELTYEEFTALKEIL